jgi:serine/threonine-protein kinase
MGTLFLARRSGHGGFEREVVIKVLHDHLSSDPESVQMFVDEARLASRIHHPNVRKVENLGVQDGTHYMVLEYVPGCSLSELLAKLSERGVRLAPVFAIYVASRVAEALHAAHGLTGEEGRPLGLVHRDICPKNILIDREGHVKLIDFGIAKVSDRITSAGLLKGKPAYMAPEQVRGDVLDRRTDVYALGLVLWEMLTSERALRGTRGWGLLRAALEPSIPRLSTRVEVTRALEDAVGRALVPDPAGRYSTAWQFRRALLRAVPRARSMEAPQLRALLRIATEERVTAECVLPEWIEQTVRTPPGDRGTPTADTDVEHIEDLSDLRHEPFPDLGA